MGLFNLKSDEEKYQDYLDSYYSREDSRQAAKDKKIADAIGSRAVEGDTGLRQIGGEDNLVSDIGMMIEPQAATGAYADASDKDMKFADLAKRLAMAGDTETAANMLEKMQSYEPPQGTTDARDYEKAVSDGSWKPEWGGFNQYEQQQNAQRREAQSTDLDPTIPKSYAYSDGSLITDIFTKKELRKEINKGNVIQLGEKDQLKLRGFNQMEEYADSIEDDLFGEEGIYSDYVALPKDADQWDSAQRMIGESFEAGLNTFTQNDPRYRAYSAKVEAMAGWAFRNLTGEVGNLNRDEVQRGMAIFPSFTQIKGIGEGNTYVTDSPEVARLKFANFKALLDSWRGDMLKGNPMSIKALEDAEKANSKIEKDNAAGMGKGDAVSYGDMVREKRKTETAQAPTGRAPTLVRPGGVKETIMEIGQLPMFQAENSVDPIFEFGGKISDWIMSESREEQIEREKKESWENSGSTYGRPR